MNKQLKCISLVFGTLAVCLLLRCPLLANSETVYVGSAPYTTAVSNACGGSSTLSDMNTNNSQGYGCFEGDWGSGAFEECKFVFSPASGTKSNIYQIDMVGRGGDDCTCGSVNGREFGDLDHPADVSGIWNYDAASWTNGVSAFPWADGGGIFSCTAGWSGPTTFWTCASKSACSPYIQSSPAQFTYHMVDTDGGFLQDQDGIEIDVFYLTVYYDPTAPTVSWTSSGFGAYDTDGTASATLTVSDAGGSGLAASDYCWVRSKTNGTWGSWSKVGENGYVCTSTAGDNQYIQCDAYCEDQVNNTSSTVQTTNSLVDLNIPLSSQPTVDNPYFSPNNSAAVKDTATTSMNPTDSASGVGCYQMEVKDSTGATHVKWHTAGTCAGTANYSAWTSNPTTWAWDGKNDSSAFVAEGTYRVYVKAKDNAGWFSSATGATDTQTCSTETLTTGVSVSGTGCGASADTGTNNSVYRQIDEANVAAVENRVAVGAQNNFGVVNSGTYVSTQVQDNVDWDWNEQNGWCGINPFAYWLDFDMRYNTDVPESTITALKLQTRYKTENDDFELYWYNYDTSSFTDLNTGTLANQSAYATYNYTLCSGAMGVCNAWVSSGGDITMKWYDEQNCGIENSDFFKIDYQQVEVDYNQRKLDVSYEFTTTLASLASISSVVLKTDAYSGNEAMLIYKWNYSSSSWENTGYTTPSTEPVSPQTITLCNSNCSTYVTDTGPDRRFKIRYVDSIAKDATVNRLSIDYQVADVNYGANWVQTVVDNTNPSTSDNWTDNWTGTSPVNVSLTATDNLSGIEYTKYCVDTASCTPSATYTAPISVTCAAGSVCTQYVYYQSRDNAGNSDSVASKHVRQDLQSPTTTDNWTDNWTNTSPVTVTLTPSDGSGSGVQATYYCVDTINSCTPSTSGTSVSVTCASGSACTQYVRYYSKDNVNNSESVNSKRVRQDRITPTIGTVTPANTDSGTYVDGTFDLSASVTEADSGALSCDYCKSTDGVCDTEWTAGTVSGSAPNYTCSISGLTCTDGQSLTLNIRLKDVALNTGTGTTVARTCDTNPPTFTLTAWDTGCAGTQYTNNESYNDSSPSFCYSATDARAGLHATTPYTYYFGTDCSGTPSTNTALSSYGASGLTDATKYCFRVYATDAVGNTSSTSTFTYIYNTTAPSWRYPGVGSQVGAFYGGGTIRTYGAEQRFYGASYTGIFYALEAATGALRWSYDLTSPTNYGVVSSPPLVFNNKIYLGTESGYVLRLTDNGASATIDESRNLGACAIQSATLTITISGATKILVGCGANIYALNDDATFTNWSAWTTNPRAVTGSVTRSIPAYAVQPGGVDPYFYVATQNGTLADASYGNLYKIDINLGTILNTFGDSTDFAGFLILRNYFGGGQWIYTGGANSNKFYAIRTSAIPASCTAPNCYSFSASSGFEGGAAASSGGSVIYAGNNNGTLYRLNFNGSSLTSPYNFNAGGAVKYGVTFRQTTGRLYFGTDTGMFFIVTDNGASFTENMRYQTGAAVSATPAVNSTAGKVVIPGVIGRIFSFVL